MGKVSEFAATLDPWGVYAHADLAEAFRKECGEEPCWSVMTPAQARTSLEQRGKGGYVEEGDGSPVVFGHAAALAMAARHAPGEEVPFRRGVGSQARVAVEALVRAGK